VATAEWHTPKNFGLHKWGQRKGPTCSHCGQQTQTVEHLLHKRPVHWQLDTAGQLEDEKAIKWISRYSKACEKKSKVSKR